MTDINTVAEEILNQGKKAVCRELPPFLRAVNAWEFQSSENGLNYTNGSIFYYSPESICKKYKADKNSVTRLLLHSLLHCSLLHIFNTDFKNKELWNLACDICVEKIIIDSRIPCSINEKNASQQNAILNISKNIKNFTAENIYYYFSDKKFDKKLLGVYEELFAVDSHGIWYSNSPFGLNEEDDLIDVEARSIYKMEDDRQGDSQKGGQSLDNISNSQAENPEDAWREITKQIIRDFDIFPSQIGNSVGDNLQILKAVTRDKYDYSDLLKKFIETDESLEINDDEFDYIYYTYGLKLYENIPLIEPLEYAENGKIRKLVVAIDTSGSVIGETVEGFIRKTYSILKSTSFFKKDSEIHILQCDSEIQHIEIIKSERELDEYIENLVLHGFGGTDFTPVFKYVDELYETSSKKELNGLIYLTDGDGIYPEKAPQYKNAFIIYDNGFDKNRLPSWSIPIYIDRNELIQET